MITSPHAQPDVPHHDVRMEGVHFVRASAHGTFARSLDPSSFSYCVMVRYGRLRLETDFPVATEIDLGAGDAVAIGGLTPHVFRSRKAASLDEIERFQISPMTGPEQPADVQLIVGIAPSEALALGSLMIGPIVVRAAEHPDLSHRLWRAVEMLEDEYANASWIDRNLVIRRMAETMLINMSRRVFAERRAPNDAALRAPSSSQVMLAINAFFRAPETAWTLSGLAKAAGMSRTRFAEEFKLVTGQTPGKIVARMRLTTVARRLVTESLSVEAAADEAGYSCAAAFVRAFQREFGETPARWRRQRSARHGKTTPLQTAPPRPGRIRRAATGASQWKDAP